MFTEAILHENPTMCKGIMGIPAEVFWKIVAVTEKVLPAVDRERLAREKRTRRPGAGRKYDQPVGLRVAAVLSYLRLHVPQEVVALLYGMTQTDISRDLRRLLPAIQQALPCPAVWRVLEEGTELTDADCLTLCDLADERVLVDATEQRVSRPQASNEERKRYYSGKKKQFTLKTQLVTDGAHHIEAISESVPGAQHDKSLCDETCTLDRLPDGCEAAADKGYQGLEKQVERVVVIDTDSGAECSVPRLVVQTPYKKPKGRELTEAEQAFNAALSAIRVRIEHCIGWAKNWAILANRFRCDHTIYTAILRTICGLVNLQTDRWQAAKSSPSANSA